MDKVHSACQEIHTCTDLGVLLHAILAAGKVLNHGTPKGLATGMHLAAMCSVIAMQLQCALQQSRQTVYAS